MKRMKNRLAGAHVGLDPVSERGMASRGAYIVDAKGTEYLSQDGKWTHGITGDHNWWNNWAEASDFLRAMKANASHEAERRSESDE